MNVADFRDIGGILSVVAAAGGRAVAGGTGDATEVNGQYVDRKDYSSAVLVIAGTAVLQAGETLSIAANIQDDADGSGTGVDFGDAFANAVVATGDTGGSTEHFEVRLDFDLTKAKQYVRAQVTPNLSAGGTDTLQWGAAWVFGPKQDQS